MVNFDSPLDQEFLDEFYQAQRETWGDDLTRPIQFIIGRLNADGSVSTVVTSGEFGRIWVRQPGEDTGDAVQAINTILQPHEISPDRPVMVKQDRGEFVIVARAPESANYDAQIPASPQRATYRQQYLVAMIYPSQPDSSFFAYYAGGIFQLNSVAYRITDTPSSDFSDTVPGSNAISIKVEIDPTTATWHETTGGAFTGGIIDAFKDGDLDTARTEGRFLIGWIRLYDGQTAIELEDILLAEYMLDIEENPFSGAWNGTFKQNFDLLVTEAGGIITGSLDATNGGDLRVYFSDGGTDLNTDPSPLTVTLTAGTATTPQINHVYVLQSNKTLTAKTSTYLEDWPSAEHAPVALVILRTAAITQNDNALGNQNINNRAENDNDDNQGWIQIAGNNMRSQGPHWFAGVTPTITIVTNGGAPDDVYLANTSGIVRQFNPQTFPAINMQTGDDIHIANRFGSAWTTVSNLNGELTDSTNASMSGKYFWLTFWGIINKTGEMSHLVCNLPDDSYNTQANALADVDNTKNRSIPIFFHHTGFLIAETLFRHQPAASGTWTEIETNTLLAITGGDGGSTIVDPITSFSDAVFNWFNSTDPTKLVDVDLSGITASATRTITMPDKDGTMAMLDDVDIVLPHVPDGRLSLTSADPNDESDVTSATLYYVQNGGNTIMVFNLADVAWEELTFDNTSLSLAAETPNTLYDFYGYDNSGFTLEAVTWGINTEYNISAMTAADPCVITYLNGSQVFAVGDNVCIQDITGNINTVTHIVTSVTAIATLVGGVSYQIQIQIDTTGLTYTSDGTVRLLKETRATAIGIRDGIPVQGGAFERRYLGTGLIHGDGGKLVSSQSRQLLANYYNRVHRKIRSSLDADTTFTTAVAGAYRLPGTPNQCNDGQGRVSYVAPYGGTDIHGIWAAGASASTGSTSVLALEQNTIEDFAREPAGDSAFGDGTVIAARFSSLFANSENEGYNYIQQMIFGNGGNITVWAGNNPAAPKFRYGLRGYINA